MSRIVTNLEQDAIICDLCGGGSLLSEAYADEWVSLKNGQDACIKCAKVGSR